jgi:hypothetical protein
MEESDAGILRVTLRDFGKSEYMEVIFKRDSDQYLFRQMAQDTGIA